MRPDQLEKLKALREQLADELLKEANPATWPATDSAQGRGDRYWMKKNALATGELIEDLTETIALAQAAMPPGVLDDQMEEEMKRFEAQGAAVLKRYQKKKPS